MEKHLTNKDLNAVLPEATAAKFEVIALEGRTSTRVMSTTHGEIDFTTLSIPRATQLVKNKFPYLRERTKKDAPEEKGKGSDTSAK